MTLTNRPTGQKKKIVQFVFEKWLAIIVRVDLTIKIRHYRQLYADKPDPVIFLPVAMNTSGHIYEDFVRLLFLHTHREVSILSGELPEESDQFRFFEFQVYLRLLDTH